MPDDAHHRRWDDIADDRFLSRREADILIANTIAAEEERNVAHLREHAKEGEAIDKALIAESKQQQQHNIAHDKAHDSHEAKHHSEDAAVKVALASLDRERRIHAEAHDREHVGHQREHSLANLAIDKAEAATDKRFEGVNGSRAQMDAILRNLTSQDSFDAFAAEFARFREDSRADMDRRFADAAKLTQDRYEANRASIIALEKGDVKAEGRGIGQGAVVAVLVTVITVVGGLLGTLIVVANFFTGTP